VLRSNVNQTVVKIASILFTHFHNNIIIYNVGSNLIFEPGISLKRILFIATLRGVAIACTGEHLQFVLIQLTDEMTRH
jgi:hypothetical protein